MRIVPPGQRRDRARPRGPSPGAAAGRPGRAPPPAAPSARSPSGPAQGGPCASISAISMRSPISAACSGGTRRTVAARIRRRCARRTARPRARRAPGSAATGKRRRRGGGPGQAPRHGGDRLDHVGVADRQRLAAVGGHGVDGGAVLGAAEHADPGERPVAERALLEVGQHQRGVAEGDHHLARSAPGASRQRPSASSRTYRSSAVIGLGRVPPVSRAADSSGGSQAAGWKRP